MRFVPSFDLVGILVTARYLQSDGLMDMLLVMRHELLPTKVRLRPTLLFFGLSIDKNKSEISTALLRVTHVAQAVSVGTTSIKVPVVERSIPGWKLVGGLEHCLGSALVPPLTHNAA